MCIIKNMTTIIQRILAFISPTYELGLKLVEKAENLGREIASTEYVNDRANWAHRTSEPSKELKELYQKRDRLSPIERKAYEQEYEQKATLLTASSQITL